MRRFEGECGDCGQGLYETDLGPRLTDEGVCEDREACDKYVALLAARPDVAARREEYRALRASVEIRVALEREREARAGLRFECAYDAAVAYVRRHGTQDAELDAESKAAFKAYMRTVSALANARDKAWAEARAAAVAA